MPNFLALYNQGDGMAILPDSTYRRYSQHTHVYAHKKHGRRPLSCQSLKQSPQNVHLKVRIWGQERGINLVAYERCTKFHNAVLVNP